MKARAAALSPNAKLALAAGAVLVYALALWFLVVGPKRSEASSLATQVASAEANLAASKGPMASGNASTPAADVVRLAKAMPSSADQAGLVLELSRLGREAAVSIASIAPTEPTTDASGATLVPVTVTVTGTYRQVTAFLHDATSLVGVSGGRLHATGRLFAVRGVELAESSAGKFPLLDATVALDAYAYDGPISTPTPPPPPPSASGSTSGATAAGGTS